MANVFNAAEAIDMGIEKERKRRDFYGYAAQNFKEKDMVELFSHLRDWEDTHIKKFTARYGGDKLTPVSPETGSFPFVIFNPFGEITIPVCAYSVAYPCDVWGWTKSLTGIPINVV